MAIATATSLDVYVAGKLLFGDVSFKLEPGDRMTLSGRNGAGKSTLLRVLAGELTPEEGTVSIQRGARVALHDQRPPRDSDAKLGDYVFSGRNDMLETEAELARLEGEMAGGASEETMNAYAAAQARLEAGGGYRWRDEVLEVLRGLGFGPEHADRPLSTFSGGELTRASLARALAARPDLLLLDEPTNHLDIPSLEWLERYLVGIDSAVVLVAHDRWFLEAVGTSVLELEAQRARFFAGPWHAWRQEQAARQIALGKAIDRHEAEMARMERFVERFRYKASKAKQAQSRVKAMDKKKKEGPGSERRDNRRLRFSFKPPERPGRVVLKMADARIEVPGRVLIEDANLEVERGEHVVLVGANGSGKTTMIETLAGQKQPAAGIVRTGHNVNLGYLSQHADTAAGEGTVLDAAQRETGLTGPKARALLGGFLFSGGDVEKRLSDISGGEQRRLSLAILVSSGANVLVLDEPTNHLDIESREALEDALTEFEGSVVLISHDRALLEAVGSRTIVVEDQKLTSHPSGWAEYQRRRDEREAEGDAAASSAAKKEKASGNGAQAKRRDGKAAERAGRKAARLEQRIEKAEADLKAVEEELADPAAWSSPSRTERATEKHEAAKAAVEGLLAEWEAAQGAAEAAAT
ncbi:MAG TPA: ABC-F family ATP-binding cassette domain-containing protein [Solirubrobacterales bacterium]|nr:ABC-F family ATP-binding cassette domain-containing protein [Solirubrobacterales bacterium]